LNVSGSVFTGVQEINPKGGKESRMNIAAAEWQAHDWYIDRKAGWAESFVEQITTFPSGRYDDMVDAMSQAACWLASFTPTTGELRGLYGPGALARVTSSVPNG
jgi:predicted phage terminase large subunit-like protein